MNKLQYMTRGGQVFFHNIRMLVQVNKSIGRWMLFLFLIVFLLCAYCIMPKEVVINTAQYYLAFFWRLIHVPEHLSTIHFQGQTLRLTAENILHEAYFPYVARRFWCLAFVCLLMGFVLVALASIVCMRWLAKKGQSASEDQYLRGSRLATVADVNRCIQTPSAFHLDALHFPRDFERQHVLYHGTSGSGKSVAMLKQLLQIRRLGQRVALTDISGAFLSRLYTAGDVILNPFDQRSCQWVLWDDCPDSETLFQLASYLIPEHPRAEPIWVNAPRQIFVATAEKLRDDPERSYSKLLRIMLSLPMKEYTEYFEGTDVASLTDERIEKTVLSIRAVLASYLRPLRFLDQVRADAPRFSLRAWLRNDQDRRWLFMTVQEEHLVSMRGLLTGWVGFLANGVLSLPEDVSSTRHLWFSIDEFSSLYKIAGFSDALSKIRKFGGHFMLGMQSYPQLVKNYGKDEADEIIDLLSTQLFFRSNRETVARFASTQLGEQEIEKVSQNYSYGANTIRDGISFGKQIMRRQVVMPAEIQNLANLACYILQLGDVPSSKLVLDLKPIQQLTQVTSPFDTHVTVETDAALDRLIMALRFNPLTMNDEALRDVIAQTTDDIKQELSDNTTQFKQAGKTRKKSIAKQMINHEVSKRHPVDEIVEASPDVATQDNTNPSVSSSQEKEWM